jgi:hypothetical protein
VAGWVVSAHGRLDRADRDTARFYAAYREYGHGRAAYEPSMMIALRTTP